MPAWLLLESEAGSASSGGSRLSSILSLCLKRAKVQGVLFLTRKYPTFLDMQDSFNEEKSVIRIYSMSHE
jgi:hypothetical protein